jgi:hypothetical protein
MGIGSTNAPLKAFGYLGVPLAAWADDEVARLKDRTVQLARCRGLFVLGTWVDRANASVRARPQWEELVKQAILARPCLVVVLSGELLSAQPAVRAGMVAKLAQLEVGYLSLHDDVRVPA